MSRPPIRYLFKDVDRHGNERRYFRRRLPGQSSPIKIRLYSEYGTEEFAKEYLAAMQLHGLGFFSMTREEKRPGTIYFAGFDQWVKIGFTTDLQRRIGQLQTACPAQLLVYAAFPGIAGYERSLHRRFRAARAIGEWFRFTRTMKAFIRDLGGPHDRKLQQNSLEDNLKSGGPQKEIPL